MQSATKKLKEMPELSPEIEERIKMIESGKITGKKHTSDEYISMLIKS